MTDRAGAAQPATSNPGAAQPATSNPGAAQPATSNPGAGRPSGLRLHDTYAGAVRDFVPLRDGHVSIYLCGATVDTFPHIGHVRSAVAFDVLRRWLMARGFDVAFIRNVTDIDD